MSGRTNELARVVIDHYGLHDHGAPVDLLRTLRRAFPVVYRDLRETELYGFGLPFRHRRSDYPHRRGMVVIDGGLDDATERRIYAHEVGHLILGHAGSLRTLAVEDWFHDRAEFEAWEIAAALLVPYDVVVGRWSWTEQEIAALCEVPVELVQIHPGLRS